MQIPRLAGAHDAYNIIARVIIMHDNLPYYLARTVSNGPVTLQYRVYG